MRSGPRLGPASNCAAEPPAATRTTRTGLLLSRVGLSKNPSRRSRLRSQARVARDSGDPANPPWIPPSPGPNSDAPTRARGRCPGSGPPQGRPGSSARPGRHPSAPGGAWQAGHRHRHGPGEAAFQWAGLGMALHWAGSGLAMGGKLPLSKGGKRPSKRRKRSSKTRETAFQEAGNGLQRGLTPAKGAEGTRRRRRPTRIEELRDQENLWHQYLPE